VQTYKVKLGERSATLRATAPDVALKRFLGGGWAAGYRYATVHAEDRFRMKVGDTAQIVIARIA
jgi:hypothetical protein